MIYRQATRLFARAAPLGARTFATTSNRVMVNKKMLLSFATLCAGTSIAVMSAGSVHAECTSQQIELIKKDIAAAIAADAEKREDGTSMIGTLVRLAWHQSGTYSKVDGSGGSDGAHMRFSPEKDWGANAGLGAARDFLEPIKAKYPDISYADLWTLAGVVAIEEAGGPKINWRQGRKDSPAPTSVPDGRLPAADSGCPAADAAHIRDIFGRMGFSDREMVALIGAHAVGRCHTEASGYWGPWTNAENTFSNEFFRLLVEEEWRPKKTHMGKKWTGPAQFENKDGSLMMLPADLALASDPAFRKYTEEYSKDEAVFFKDFAGAFEKLLELGVPSFQKKGLFGLGFFGL